MESAGQWARRLIINEDLDKGTMLPFMAHARETGLGLVVMNTNMNTDTKQERTYQAVKSLRNMLRLSGRRLFQRVRLRSLAS